MLAMLGWLVLGAAALAMYRIADAEGRSPWLWAAITVALCLLFAFLLPTLPLVNIGIGAAIAFGAMFVAKIASGPR